MKVICSIYRSSKKEGMYLYVDKKEDTERVPEALLARFGKPVHAMTLLLHSDRKLARVDVDKVLKGIEKEGYFLQMPPQPEKEMSKIHQLNSKM